jgi:hypothetical protein
MVGYAYLRGHLLRPGPPYGPGEQEDRTEASEGVALPVEPAAYLGQQRRLGGELLLHLGSAALLLGLPYTEGF